MICTPNNGFWDIRDKETKIPLLLVFSFDTETKEAIVYQCSRTGIMHQFVDREYEPIMFRTKLPNAEIVDLNTK